ncbi:hypothetical protein ACF0H5_014633 [Mactra antiquata]
MEFSATFPSDTTTTECIVELLLSIENFLFGIGDIKGCQTGTALSTGNIDYCNNYKRHVAPGFNQEDAMKHHSRVVFHLGDVVSSAVGSETDRTLAITFEAVLVSMGDKNIDDKAYVSAGMQITNGEYIWVARYEVTLKGSQAGDDRIPNFDLIMVDDDEIKDDGEQQKVQLTFGLSNTQADVRVEFVSMNYTHCSLSVQGVSLKQAGSAYAYSLDAAKLVSDNTGKCCPSSASVNLGRLTNKESTKSKPNMSNYDIVIEATILATNKSVTNGDILGTGVAIFVDQTEVWVSYIAGTKRNGEPASNITFTTRVTGGSTIAPGLPCGMEVDVNTISGGHRYTLQITTEKGTALTDRLHILAINPVSSGTNVPCEINAGAMTIEYDASTENPDVVSSATLNVTIFNYGTNSNNSANAVVTFSVFFRLTTEAQEGENVKATVSVNGNKGETKTFSVGKTAKYDSDVSYQFDLQQPCNSSFPAGTVILFKLIVTTDRGKIPGPTKLEFPIPADLQTSTLTFVSAKVVSVGKNVGCVPVGDLDVELFDWPASPPGTNDRVIATIMLCNIQVVDDVEADKFTIEFKVKMKDDPSFYSDDSPKRVQFGLGWQFSSTRIMAINYDIDVLKPTDYGDGVIKYVKGLTFGNTTWPEDALIQWSPNNEEYYSFNSSWEHGNTSEMLLTGSLFTRYVKVINTDGQCPVGNKYITEDVGTDIEFHGNTSFVKILRQSIMFLLDKDNSTCLNLPTKSAIDTTRFLYFNIKTILPYLDTNGSSPFYLIITGNGISCDTPFGPQVTKISHRTDDGALKFKGNRRKCQLDGHDEVEGKQTCRYHCNCSNATTCADVSILVLHHKIPDVVYSLCDVTALQ